MMDWHTVQFLTLHIPTLKPYFQDYNYEDEDQREEMLHIFKIVSILFRYSASLGSVLMILPAYTPLQLEKGRIEARNTDTFRLKNGIPSLFGLHHTSDRIPHPPWNPPLDVADKKNWGYFHDEIAFLLTPVGMLEDHAENPQ